MPDLGRSRYAGCGNEPGDMTELAASNADNPAYLSSRSDAVLKLKRQLDTLPEIRQQRVHALKQAINDGTYKISPHAVATAMLSDLGLRAG